MTILYIFPHPDDESFGPAAAIDAQLKQGHKVYLYTLTRGGASRQRFVYNYSVEEMGNVRYKEMLDVERTLGLTGMRVDDFPDSGLKHMDPRVLEHSIEQHIGNVRPDIVVTYPVHGVSGFHDHLIVHGIVKRVYLDMKDKGASYLRRLAFFTLPDSGRPAYSPEHFWRLKQSIPEEIGCIVQVTEENMGALKAALDCYTTYQETIRMANIPEKLNGCVHFELFGETFSPPLSHLTDELPPRK